MGRVSAVGTVEGARAGDGRLVSAGVPTAPASGAEPSSATVVCEALVRELRRRVPAPAIALMSTDPTTHLPSGGTVQGFSPDDCGPFWRNELVDADFNKFADVGRRPVPVATLRAACDGDLTRSPRWRDLYAPNGLSDELRFVLRVAEAQLAVGVLVRADGHDFSEADVAAVVSFLPDAGRRIADAWTVPAGDLVGAPPPVLLVLDATDGVVAVSEGAEALLEDLRVNPVDGNLPGVIAVAAARVRASASLTSLTTRLCGRSGRWVRLHVACVAGAAGTVAVHVDQAPPDELATLLLEGYGLTARETEIVLRLCRGRSAKELARELGISIHTVRDHLRAVYDKSGVTSRGELVAALFADHVLDRMHAAVTHLP